MARERRAQHGFHPFDKVFGRRGEIAALLELLGTSEDEALRQELKSFATGLAGYWGYYERAVVYDELRAQQPCRDKRWNSPGWNPYSRWSNTLPQTSA